MTTPSRISPKTAPPHVVFDAVDKLTPAQGKKALKPGGVYINVHADSDGGDKLENLLVLQKTGRGGQAQTGH